MSTDTELSPPIKPCQKCSQKNFCAWKDGAWVCFWGCPERTCTSKIGGVQCFRKEFHNGSHQGYLDKRPYFWTEHNTATTIKTDASCKHEKKPLHPCPFDADVHDDVSKLCDCCSACERKCELEI